MVHFHQLLPLLLCYTHQGIIIGFGSETVPILLVEQKVAFSEVGLVYLTFLPFVLKPFYAPLFDKIYLRQFGKQKSQIIPLLLIQSFIIFFTGHYFQNLVAVNNGNQILIFLFIIISITATIDISVDGWVIDLLDEGERGYGSACQTFGQTIGAFFSSYLFLLLNSKEFCGKYFQTDALITFPGMFQICGGFGTLISLYIYFYPQTIKIQETDVFNLTQINYQYSFTQIFLGVFNFWKNKYLYYIGLFLLCFRLGLIPIDFYSLILINQGFPKESISFVHLIYLPISFILPFFGAFLIKDNRLEFRYIIYISIYKLINGIFMLIQLFWYSSSNIIINFLFYGCYLLNKCFSDLLILLAFSFVWKITQKEIGSTYIALLGMIRYLILVVVGNCIALNRVFGEAAVNILMNNINYYCLCIIGMICHLFILQSLGKKVQQNVISFDQMDKSQYELPIFKNKEFITELFSVEN